MIDIHYLVENPEKVKENIKSRQKNMDQEIDQIKEIYLKYREQLVLEEDLKSELNMKSKKIGEYKRNGQDVEVLLSEIEEIKSKLSLYDVEKLRQDYQNKLDYLPNLLAEDTPYGESEDDNVEIKKWGEIPNFSFVPKEHYTIGEETKTIDAKAAVKIAKSRFVVTQGLVARLERALMNFMLDEHNERGYLEVSLPYIANEESFYGAGKFPKFGANELFKLDRAKSEEEDEFDYTKNFYLIPTSEVALANIHRDEQFTSEELPLHYCSFTQCFRKEAGSAGRDTKGLIRLHQFGKVELFKYIKPSEEDFELQKMLGDVENILQKLQIPYRIVRLCSGDMGDTMSKTYDFEAWFPGENRYVEVSSCSSARDYQTRRLKTRYKEGNKKEFLYTLNGSGLATGRIVAAILENYQTETGEIVIPEILKEYFR